MNLPPSYLLIHRVTLSTIGVLCQLGATVRLRDELESWLPGFLLEHEPDRESEDDQVGEDDQACEDDREGAYGQEGAAVEARSLS